MTICFIAILLTAFVTGLPTSIWPDEHVQWRPDKPIELHLTAGSAILLVAGILLPLRQGRVRRFHSFMGLLRTIDRRLGGYECLRLRLR